MLSHKKKHQKSLSTHKSTELYSKSNINLNVKSKTMQFIHVDIEERLMFDEI